MAERDDLLASIAATTVDYREGDLPAPTPEHVGRWINQFDAEVQLPILRELDHVLKQTYWPAPIWWPGSNLMHRGLGGYG